MFAYQIVTDEVQATIYFEGDIDIDAGDVLEDEIEPAVATYTNIILNLEKVFFVDSSGIGLIIRLVQVLQELGRNVYIEQTQPEVMEVFELLQLDEILGKEIFR